MVGNPWQGANTTSVNAINANRTPVMTDIDDMRGLFGKLQRKWRHYGSDITDFWNNTLDEEKRKSFILSVSPHTPISEEIKRSASTGEDVFGAVLLVPELTLDKVVTVGHLPSLCDRYFGSDFEERVMEALDVVERTGLRKNLGRRGMVTLHNMKSFDLTAKATDKDYEEMLSMPGIVAKDKFDVAMDRVGTMTMVLLSIFTEYEDEATLGARSRLTNSVLGCSNPPCDRRLGKDGGKLRPCKNCRRVSYCSRSCQKRHASAHESYCKKHAEDNKAAASSM